MSRIKYAADPSFTKPWATKIGQLILNFSGLEFESYLWLVQMSEQPEQIPEFTKLTYASRVKKIKSFIKSSAFSDDWGKVATARWNESLELAKLRNRVGHNPLLFAWVEADETGEPDYIGVADMKAKKPLEDTEGPLLSKSAITDAVNQANKLVSNLASLRKKWCDIRDTNRNVSTP